MSSTRSTTDHLPARTLAALRDGTRVLVRPIEPADKALLLEGFERLSEESRYRRFLAPMPELNDATLRYLTEVDLSRRTTTGDPQGEVVEEHEPPSREELGALLEPLRGVVELRVPAASAVKIGGERAYKLHRRGVEVEMPLRRSHVDELTLVGYENGVATLDLSVGSGTYVRSIAEALGGHCVTLRRTEIGPFSVDEADEELLLPIAEALARLG